MAADTPAVSEPFVAIAALVSGSGDQPREQLDGLHRLLRIQRLKPRRAEQAFAHRTAIAALGRRRITNVRASPRLAVLLVRS